MSFSPEDAIFDEPTREAIPTSGELGRQVKRLKTSTILNSITGTQQIVTDDGSGLRFAKASRMPADMNNDGGVPDLALVNAVGIVINEACAPGGAITAAISAATATINAARDTITATLRAVEQRSTARLYNGNVFNKDGKLQSLMGINNRIPEPFPLTYGDFARLNTAEIEQLLESYDLEVEGTRKEKLGKLSAFCNVKLPK